MIRSFVINTHSDVYASKVIYDWLLSLEEGSSHIPDYKAKIFSAISQLLGMEDKLEVEFGHMINHLTSHAYVTSN